MNAQEQAVIEKFRKLFVEDIDNAFPRLPFSATHPITKFVGVIEIKSQKSVALFIKSQQPLEYDELVLD